MSHSIYVISRQGTDSPCKIGISANPERRLAQLQTGSAEKLEIGHQHIVDSAALAAFRERLAHEHFADVRLSGEWFDATLIEIRAFLSNCIDEPAPAKAHGRTRVERGTAIARNNFAAFHPQIPIDLLGVPISEMAYPDRVRFWSACELPPPPDGFDDWYLIGSPATGVLGAFPVVGFICQEPSE